MQPRATHPLGPIVNKAMHACSTLWNSIFRRCPQEQKERISTLSEYCLKGSPNFIRCHSNAPQYQAIKFRWRCVMWPPTAPTLILCYWNTLYYRNYAFCCYIIVAESMLLEYKLNRIKTVNSIERYLLNKDDIDFSHNMLS